MTGRKVFALDLVDDRNLIDAYKKRHEPGAVWPEVLRDIRSRGWSAMEIWHIADRLVMIVDDVADIPIDNEQLNPRIDEWEAEMAHYQRPIFPNGPKWAPMARIFAFNEQPE